MVSDCLCSEENDAKSLLTARNYSQAQFVLNLHLARAYIKVNDRAFEECTAKPS